ncbi:MAG: preprotein translocase subunit SecE [bacterium]|nr:preprotein translocase subunit SecE [bacterium]
MTKLSAYLKECRHEIGKVIWPSKKQLTTHSILVIGVSLFVAAFIGVADYVFTVLFEQFIRLR